LLPVTGWPKPVPWWPSRGDHAHNPEICALGPGRTTGWPAAQSRRSGTRRASVSDRAQRLRVVRGRCVSVGLAWTGHRSPCSAAGAQTAANAASAVRNCAAADGALAATVCAPGRCAASIPMCWRVCSGCRAACLYGPRLRSYGWLDLSGQPAALRPGRLGGRVAGAMAGHAAVPGPDGSRRLGLAAGRGGRKTLASTTSRRSCRRRTSTPFSHLTPRTSGGGPASGSTTASARRCSGRSCLRTSSSDRSARSAAWRARTCQCRRSWRRPWPRGPPRAWSPCHAGTGEARSQAGSALSVLRRSIAGAGTLRARLIQRQEPGFAVEVVNLHTGRSGSRDAARNLVQRS
jgi:hypothetical protein